MRLAHGGDDDHEPGAGPRVSATRRATLLIFSASATEEPPYFWTISAMGNASYTTRRARQAAAAGISARRGRRVSCASTLGAEMARRASVRATGPRPSAPARPGGLGKAHVLAAAGYSHPMQGDGNELARVEQQRVADGVGRATPKIASASTAAAWKTPTYPGADGMLTPRPTKAITVQPATKRQGEVQRAARAPTRRWTARITHATTVHSASDGSRRSRRDAMPVEPVQDRVNTRSSARARARRPRSPGEPDQEPP